VRWTRKSIIAEIRRLKNEGAELNYATAESEYLNLVRAAAWHFGTWRRAVEAAGIDYESLCKYKRWNRDRIVARIRELKHEGAELSWRAVSTKVDPPLAAAALRPNGFKSWPEAVQAAGLDINDIARYQNWSAERVLREIKALHRAKQPLSSKAIQYGNQKLFCAARRRFGSWDGALEAAGISAEKIRLRSPMRGEKASKNGVPSDVSLDHGVVANGRVRSPKAIAKAVKSARANQQPALPLSVEPAKATKTARGKVVAKTSPVSSEPKAKATAAKTATTKTATAASKAKTTKAAPPKAPKTAAKTSANAKAPAKKSRSTK
jgi:hypothetical protein